MRKKEKAAREPSPPPISMKPKKHMKRKADTPPQAEDDTPVLSDYDGEIFNLYDNS